ncbi:unnamed protein product [Acanthoscelides obtectus]|uniref:Uncharacterized protein n=1 Tax=Acanthoscelides obtectus TaxID=200917 RepID=A0A9P0PG25_ACAOB|nr:unnamed protein product [Acanthoscelides obtectus]CAK1677062.1 hypothetical protein AOBTE_LOCUS31087 [Acanthoscelides obtectus]
MEKDKSRGRKHIQDKHKYKGNTVKNPKHVPLPTKPVLESNEDRYVEDKSNSHSFQLSSSTDFAILSKTPISRGHHFSSKVINSLLMKQKQRLPVICFQ